MYFIGVGPYKVKEMEKILKFFKRHWWFLTHSEVTCTLTPEEFKKLWNENLDDMRIR